MLWLGQEPRPGAEPTPMINAADLKISTCLYGAASISIPMTYERAEAMQATLRAMVDTDQARTACWSDPSAGYTAVEIDNVCVSAGTMGGTDFGLRIDLDMGTDEPLDGTHEQTELSLDARLLAARVIRTVLATDAIRQA